MIDNQFFTDLAKKLSEALPNSLKDIKTDVEKNFQAVLQTTFQKLDLVTRKEFDAQTAVLQKTRLKLEELEKKIAEIGKPGKKIANK